MEIVFNKVENIFGNGENAVYQNCSHFPTMLSEAVFLKVV